MKHTSVHGPVSYLGAADPRRQRSNGCRAARYEDAPISKLEAVRPRSVSALSTSTTRRAEVRPLIAAIIAST